MLKCFKTILKFYNIYQYVSKKFGKVKILKSPTVFELITYVSSEPSDPIRYAVSNLLYGKETIHIITLSFIVYIDK